MPKPQNMAGGTKISYTLDAYQFDIQIVDTGPKEFLVSVIQCFREAKFYNLLNL